MVLFINFLPSRVLQKELNFILFHFVKNSNLFFDANTTSEEYTEEKLRKSTRHPELRIFDIRTLITATDNFSTTNKLGQGGFGSAYMVITPENYNVFKSYTTIFNYT